MHLERTISFSADLVSVQRVLISEELARARTEAGDLDAPQHTVTNAETAPKAVTVVTVPAAKLPDKFRRLINRDVIATITQTWDGTGPDVARADFTVDVGSLPVTVSLTQTLTANGYSTSCTYSGEVKVNVPFVGAKIEKIAASKIDGILEGDQKLVNAILAS